VETLNRLYDQYRDVANFFVVYIREAHPLTDVPDGSRVEQPTTDEERSIVALLCADTLKIRIPMLVDNIDDKAARDYQGWPDRLFIVRGGEVLYAGARGPQGFLPAEMEQALQRSLAPKAAAR